MRSNDVRWERAAGAACLLWAAACGADLSHEGEGESESEEISTDISVSALYTPVPIVGLAGKCLDVQGGSSADNTPIQLWDCNGTSAQAWTTDLNGDIKALGKCLDLPANNSTSGTDLVLFSCNNSQAQKWEPLGNTIRHINSGKCVDVSGGSSASGTRIQIWDCNGTNAQRWSQCPPGCYISGGSCRRMEWQWRPAGPTCSKTPFGQCLAPCGSDSSGFCRAYIWVNTEVSCALAPLP